MGKLEPEPPIFDGKNPWVSGEDFHQQTNHIIIFRSPTLMIIPDAYDAIRPGEDPKRVPRHLRAAALGSRRLGLRPSSDHPGLLAARHGTDLGGGRPQALRVQFDWRGSGGVTWTGQKWRWWGAELSFFHICLPYIYISISNNYSIYIYIILIMFFQSEWPSTGFFYGGDSDKLHEGPNFRTILHWIRIHLTQVQDCLEHIIRRSEVEGWDIWGYLGISWDCGIHDNDEKWRRLWHFFFFFELNLEMVDVRNVWMRLCIYIIYIYHVIYIYIIYIYIYYIHIWHVYIYIILHAYMLRCRMLGLREAWLWMTAVLRPFCFSWRGVKWSIHVYILHTCIYILLQTYILTTYMLYYIHIYI